MLPFINNMISSVSSHWGVACLKINLIILRSLYQHTRLFLFSVVQTPLFGWQDHRHIIVLLWLGVNCVYMETPQPRLLL